MPPSFSHLDDQGAARMVDVSAKPHQLRRATATATLICARSTIRLLKARALPKGDVLAVARIAGLQAAKKTSELIPLCHPLPLHHLSIDFTIRADRILIHTEAVTRGPTGVEMEALTAASITALALYDMMKAADSSMHIENLHLTQKTKQP